MLGIAMNLKYLAIGGAVTAALSFAGGWQARDAFCDAALFRARSEQLTARVKHLEANIERMTRVAGEDALRSATDAAEIARLEKEINDAQITDGVCFAGPDADRVRGLWGK